MKMVQCSFCGGGEFEDRRLDYFYSHGGKFLLVPNTPTEVCSSCGMEFYAAEVIQEIERRFLAIHSNQERPDVVLQVPSKTF